VLRLAIIVVIALVLFAQFVRRTSMFFPEKYPLGNWDLAGAQDQWFTTSDGVKLHGWLFRASDPQAPLLVYFHGNAGNVTERGPIAAELARRGVSTFVFDWRGYGRSDGSPSESGLFNDAEAAYAFAAKLAPRDRIALYGESLGGPYAAWIAKKHGARCIVLDSTFPSLRALGNAMYFPVPLGWTAPFALRTRDWVNDAHIPTLVMHSHNDDVMPFRLGQSLFDGLHVPKTMYASDARGHCAIEANDGARFYEAVVGFVVHSTGERNGP
jgi:alpha-beta hydrolase superfamily lysophospholipase